MAAQLLSLFKSILVVLHVTVYSVSSQTSCTPGISDIDINQPPSTDESRYLQSSSTSNDGRQIIVPKMRFDCSGYITGWSAHTLILTEPNFIEQLTHTITFQVWRPDPTTQGYSLVGSNTLTFGGIELLTNGTTRIPESNNTAFFSFNQEILQNQQIYFVRGDVIGWFIPARFRTILPPLSPIYINHEFADDSSTMAADLLVLNATEEECSVCGGAQDFSTISAVVPLVSVQFATLPQDSACSAIESTCNITPTTTTTATPTATSTTSESIPTTPNPDPPTQSQVTITNGITNAEITCIVIAVLILLTQIVMMILCVLNLTALSQIKQGIVKINTTKSPSMMVMSPSFPPPRVQSNTPADYDLKRRMQSNTPAESNTPADSDLNNRTDKEVVTFIDDYSPTGSRADLLT